MTWEHRSFPQVMPIDFVAGVRSCHCDPSKIIETLTAKSEILVYECDALRNL